jgi:3-methyladenine DNA glycosylase AlkC
LDGGAVRILASEATRRRGAHLTALKNDPSPGLAVLEPLRSDSSRCVQDSVAIWLNDSSTSRPEWVREVAARWSRESQTAETRRICQRALRSIK